MSSEHSLRGKELQVAVAGVVRNGTAEAITEVFAQGDATVELLMDSSMFGMLPLSWYHRFLRGSKKIARAYGYELQTLRNDTRGTTWIFAKGGEYGNHSSHRRRLSGDKDIRRPDPLPSPEDTQRSEEER